MTKVPRAERFGPETLVRGLQSCFFVGFDACKVNIYRFPVAGAGQQTPLRRHRIAAHGAAWTQSSMSEEPQ